MATAILTSLENSTFDSSAGEVAAQIAKRYVVQYSQLPVDIREEFFQENFVQGMIANDKFIEELQRAANIAAWCEFYAYDLNMLGKLEDAIEKEEGRLQIVDKTNSRHMLLNAIARNVRISSNDVTAEVEGKDDGSVAITGEQLETDDDESNVVQYAISLQAFEAMDTDQQLAVVAKTTRIMLNRSVDAVKALYHKAKDGAVKERIINELRKIGMDEDWLINNGFIETIDPKFIAA